MREFDTGLVYTPHAGQIHRTHRLRLVVIHYLIPYDYLGIPIVLAFRRTCSRWFFRLVNVSPNHENAASFL